MAHGSAQSFELGQPFTAVTRKALRSIQSDAYAAMLKGRFRFRFTFRENKPRLVYCAERTDRMPRDVDIFRRAKTPRCRMLFLHVRSSSTRSRRQNYPGFISSAHEFCSRARRLRARRRKPPGLAIAYLCLWSPAIFQPARRFAQALIF